MKAEEIVAKLVELTRTNPVMVSTDPRGNLCFAEEHTAGGLASAGFTLHEQTLCDAETLAAMLRTGDCKDARHFSGDESPPISEADLAKMNSPYPEIRTDPAKPVADHSVKTTVRVE